MEDFASEMAPVREAERNLRSIREIMERSTKHSTFSGSSGIVAGCLATAGCAIQMLALNGLEPNRFRSAFAILWSLVAVSAVLADYLITKRRAASVGKRVRSRLGRQMLIAAFPGLFTGALATWFFAFRLGAPEAVYPFWMLCYGAAVSSVGIFSQPAVGRLGAAFLAAGAITLLGGGWAPRIGDAPFGLVMTAISFGGFHIVYGASDRWRRADRTA